MQDATTDAEDLEPDSPEGDGSVAARLDRLEARMGAGFDDVGAALEVASKLLVAQNGLLKRVVSAVEPPPLP